MLTGQLSKYVALGTELFSSLLEPAPGSNHGLMKGAGGTAIVSTSITVSPSIHIAVVFNGLFIAEEIYNVPINVTLAVDGKHVILEEVNINLRVKFINLFLRNLPYLYNFFSYFQRISVNKPATDINVIEVSSPVSTSDLRLLSRGKLILTVASVSNPTELRLSGNVFTKATCELFQTSLIPNYGEKTGFSGMSGLAWMYLNNEGSLVFNVQIEGLRPEQKPVNISLMDNSSKRKAELENLTPYFIGGEFFKIILFN